jgi:hypothetical protein
MNAQSEGQAMSAGLQRIAIVADLQWLAVLTSVELGTARRPDASDFE